ncbi:hypothetical protein DITRI_Ditri05aG0128900 [Diplodiscus trichospermus]
MSIMPLICRMDTLKRHLPVYGQEGLDVLRMISVRFEEKNYAIATSQSDYLRRISLKMLSVRNLEIMDANNSEATTSGVANTVPDDLREQWQLQVPPESRQRIVNKIMDTLKRHLPFYGQEELDVLRIIAVRFEEKNYAIATSQSDYLRRISLKMLSVRNLDIMDTNNSEATTSGAANTVPDDLRGQWQLQVPPESRQRIVSKIMDTLKRHLPVYGEEGLNELRMIAVRFEEKNYAIATSQSDYLRRISLKMLSLVNQPRTVCIATKRKRVMAPRLR